MLKFIDADDDLKKSMRGAKNSRDLFISAFKEKLMEKQETLQLFSLKCTNGHKMDHCIEKGWRSQCSIFAQRIMFLRGTTSFIKMLNEKVRQNEIAVQ